MEKTGGKARKTLAERLLLMGILGLAAGALWAAEAPKEKGEGVVSLFDGKTLGGWKAASEPGHGTGAVWAVKDGSIDGVQQYPGARGMLATSGKFGDFELRLEVKAEGAIDSGILLRSTMEGHAYEVTIHGREDGDVGGIAGSKIGDLPVAARDWKKAWKEGDWNEIRIAIKGEPPEIHTWLNGKQMADFKGEAKDPRVGPAGHVALEIHGAESCFNDHILFRNIRILELK